MPTRRSSKWIRGASLVEYSFLLVAILLTASGAYKLLGRRVDNGAQSAATVLDGGNGGGAIGGAIGAAAAGALGGASGAGGSGGIMGFLRDVVRGAVLGDYAENQNAGTAIGQILGGAIPGAGTAADIRDLTAAVNRARNGEPGAGRDVVLAAIGFIPVAGDAVKVIARGGDEAAGAVIGAARRNGDDAADATRRRGDAAGAGKNGDVIGEGGFVVARRQGDDVVKTIKDEVPAAGGGTVKLTPEQKRELADEMADLSNDAAKQFPPGTVPHVTVDADGNLRQRFKDGLTSDDLRRTDPAAFERAVDNANGSVKKVERAWGLEHGGTGELANGSRVKVDDNIQNFRFDKDGNVTGWIDPVAIFPKK